MTTRTLNHSQILIMTKTKKTKTIISKSRLTTTTTTISKSPMILLLYVLLLISLLPCNNGSNTYENDNNGIYNDNDNDETTPSYNSGTTTTPTNRSNNNNPLSTPAILSSFTTLASIFINLPSQLSQLQQQIQQSLPPILSLPLSNLNKLLYYKPPVGIVVILSSIRIVRRSLRFGKDYNLSKRSVMDVLSNLIMSEDGDGDDDIDNDNKYDEYVDDDNSLSPRRKLKKVNSSNRKISSKRRNRKWKGRSYELDWNDNLYKDFGTIDPFASLTYSDLLRDIIKNVDDDNIEDDDDIVDNNADTNTATADATKRRLQLETKEYATNVLNSLRITIPPRGTRERYVEKLIPLLSILSTIPFHFFNVVIVAKNGKNGNGSKSNGSKSKGNISSSSTTTTTTPIPTPQIIKGASILIEMRTLDTLLRILRDRLLSNARRLSRSEKYLTRRINYYRNGLGGGFVSKVLGMIPASPSLLIFKGGINGSSSSSSGSGGGNIWKSGNSKTSDKSTSTITTHHKKRISLLEAERNDLQQLRKCLIKEEERLGMVQIQLMYRPSWDECFTNNEDDNNDNNELDNENKSIKIHSSVIRNNEKHERWIQDACQWCHESKNLIKNLATVPQTKRRHMLECWSSPITTNAVITSTTTTTSTSTATTNNSYPTIALTKRRWYDALSIVDCPPRVICDDNNSGGGGGGILSTTQNNDNNNNYSILKLRRILLRIKRLDALNLSPHILKIYLSYIIHTIIAPKWPFILVNIRKSWRMLGDIFEFRFYDPVIGIVNDLFDGRVSNKGSSLLDGYDLKNEEFGLDNMLRDLGVLNNNNHKSNNNNENSSSSSTSTTTKSQKRVEALAAASRLYEKEVAGGAVRNVLRGNLLQLMLVQIQQLKAAMLGAIGSIDALVDSNKLNAQLLAAVPALLLVTVGTRVFFEALVRLRTQNVDGLDAAHAEMTARLRNAERGLVNAAARRRDGGGGGGGGVRQEQYDGGEGRGRKGMVITNNDLRPRELGSFMVQVHLYLMLLDYTSPPFSRNVGDAIHAGLQALLAVEWDGSSGDSSSSSIGGEMEAKGRLLRRQLGPERMIVLLRLIGEQNQELLKSL